jgi:hypothetical protein
LLCHFRLSGAERIAKGRKSSIGIFRRSAGLTEDIRGLYREAGLAGFDARAVREIIRFAGKIQRSGTLIDEYMEHAFREPAWEITP